MKLQGNYWDWVTGFKLFFSDNATDWKGYSSNDDLDKVRLIKTVFYFSICSLLAVYFAP